MKQLSTINYQPSTNKGFTLVELLLYVAILSLLVLVTTSSIYLFFQAKVKSQTISEVESAGTYVAEQIGRTIRNAKAINAPIASGSDNQTSVNVVSAGNNPTVFSLNGGKIKIKEGLGAETDLTSNRVNVTSFTVTNSTKVGSPGSLTFVYTIVHQNPSNQNEFEYSKTFNLTETIRDGI